MSRGARHARGGVIDVFWSHAREEKPLVENLNTALRVQSAHHNNVLNTNDHSRGQTSCRLAVVVISQTSLLSSSFMREMSEFAHGNDRQLVLPVFYCLEPKSELKQSNLAEKVRFWRESLGISDNEVNDWKTACLKILHKSDYKLIPEIVDNTVDVRSTPLLKQLLSHIRLLLALQVISTRIVGEKLRSVCEDITFELSNEYFSTREIRQSVELLLGNGIVRKLVMLLNIVEKEGKVQRDVAWALDSIIYRAGSYSKQVKLEAIDAGAVEVLVDMFVNIKFEWKDPAPFCLRLILHDNPDASRRLIASDNGRLKRLLPSFIKSKENVNSEDPILEACKEVLQHLSKR